MTEQKDPNIFQIAFSLLASFFGVQNQENMDRDEGAAEGQRYGRDIEGRRFAFRLPRRVDVVHRFPESSKASELRCSSRSS